MSWIDTLISLALIALVIRQIRGRKLTVMSLVWPVALVTWASFEYLGDLPPYDSDKCVCLGLALLGMTLGTGCGLFTVVYRRDGKSIAKAGWVASALWILGMSARIAFGFFALHGGAETIGDWSYQLNLHSVQTWATALVLMALAEVLARTAVLAVKLYRLA